MTLLAHPYADIFPMLPPADAEGLMLDIAEHGLAEKIVVYEGRILDGRNRYLALCEIVRVGGLCGVERLRAEDLEIGSAYLRQYGGDNPFAFVLSRNLHRRHLSESQRAMVAARIAELRQGRPSTANLRVPRQAEVAEALRVSERSVQSARHVHEHAAPEVVAAVDRGDLAVSAAEALARLPAEEQARVIREAGDPKALKRVVKDLRASAQAEKADRREAREAELAGRIAALPDKRYGVILADPEWRFEPWSRASGMDRAADNHYPTTDLEAIEARPVCNIAADDCVLFLWATAPMLPQALDVMAAWGFDYRSHLIWRKAEVNPETSRPGRVVLGTGYWLRNAHELLLIGVRGGIPAPAMGDQWTSIVDAPPRRHSEKPDWQYELIEAYFPSFPKIELNARARRPGWDAWGLEAPEDTPATPAPGTLEPAPVADNGDAALVARIAAAVGEALVIRDDLPIGDTRNLSEGARLLRRMTIHLAASRISYARIAAVLGVIKQAVGRQALEARRKIEEDAALAEAMARAEAAVGRADA